MPVASIDHGKLAEQRFREEPLPFPPSSANICSMTLPKEAPQITRVLFVRHGQTESNIARRYVGQTESPLTELGQLQANAIAQKLLGFEISALYSSDLGRTMSTAKVISSAIGRDVIAEPRLREQCFGRFEGMTVEEMIETYPDEYKAFTNRTPTSAPHGGESSAQVRDRVSSFIDSLPAQHPGETIVAVTHGAAMTAILWHLLDIPYESAKRTRIRNTGLSIFVHEQSRWILECWNDTGHLDGLLST